MEAILIHPLDLMEMYDKMQPERVYANWTAYSERVDDLIEIDGKLYYQTIRVPAKTKNLV